MLDGENSQVFFLTGFWHAELEFSKTKIRLLCGEYDHLWRKKAKLQIWRFASSPNET